MASSSLVFCAAPRAKQDVTEAFEDMREFDVPYHVRYAIDADVRCGHWFTVSCQVRERVLHRTPSIRVFGVRTSVLPGVRITGLTLTCGLPV